MRDERSGFSEDGEEGRLPEELRRELKGMFEPGVGFDGSRDAEILGAARRAGPGAAGRRGRGWWGAVGLGGVAALLAVAIGVSAVVHRSERSPAAAVRAAYVRTGDIRDAYYVARELKRGERVKVAMDENHDGKVDEVDVGLLAMAAVRLEKGGVR
jgi:hypothetical protein